MIRFFDVIIAFIAIILLSPILILVTVGVIWDMSFPVLFKQKRLGQHGNQFTILKFRSMRNLPLIDESLEKVNKYTVKVKNDPRISVVGSIIRKTSLDELPQLLNVLKGDMSLVGPRPFVLAEYENFPEDWLERLDAKPGITGLAQIRGRSNLPMEEIIECDKEWVKQRSLLLYFSVLLATFIHVIKMRNVY